MQHDPEAALASLDATTVIAITFRTPLQRHKADDMIALLASMGCILLARYGVRCVTDYMPDNDIKRDPQFFTELEKMERTLSDHEPCLRLARFYQIITRKAA